MPNQVLIIEPRQELEFKVDHAGLFQKDTSSYMWLTNPTADKVLFKIKTTAPKKYCVRPNSGILEPNSKVEIAITPQTLYVDAAEKSKHKFMVQSIIAPAELANSDQLWKEASADQLMDYKLRCIFVPDQSPHSTGSNVNDTVKQDTDNVKNAISQVHNKPVEKLKDDFKTSTPIKSISSKTDTQVMDVASSEINQLREETKKLLNENLQLKEEILRLRRVGDGRNHNVQAMEHKATEFGMMPWIMAAVVMAFIGIFLGKFVV